ncbi:MAG: hypothetical protein OWU32_14055 [Firmicutes bacterium]|nr:hypothetical protein [Bacillota bacterium]
MEIIGREHTKIDSLPINPYNSTQVAIYGLLEGRLIVRDIPWLRILHFDESLGRVKGLIIEGTEVTKGEEIQICSYSFEWNGWPSFDLLVENGETFSLSYFNEDNNKVVTVTGAATHSELGLHFSAGKEEAQKLHLYLQVLRGVLGSLSTDLQKDFPSYFAM